MNTTVRDIITTIIAAITLALLIAASTDLAHKGAHRQAVAAAASEQSVPAAFDPGYRTFMNNLYAGMWR